MFFIFLFILYCNSLYYCFYDKRFAGNVNAIKLDAENYCNVKIHALFLVIIKNTPLLWELKAFFFQCLMVYLALKTNDLINGKSAIVDFNFTYKKIKKHS
jgi:hypothetical protein